MRGRWVLADPTGQPLEAFRYLRSTLDRTRTLAAAEAEALGRDFRRWQIRDLRPKGPADLGSFVEARKRLGHRTETMTAHYVRKRVGDEVQPVKLRFLLKYFSNSHQMRREG